MSAMCLLASDDTDFLPPQLSVLFSVSLGIQTPI